MAGNMAGQMSNTDEFAGDEEWWPYANISARSLPVLQLFGGKGGM